MSGSTWRKFSLKRRLADAWHAFQFGHTRRDDWRSRDWWRDMSQARRLLRAPLPEMLSDAPANPFTDADEFLTGGIPSRQSARFSFDIWFMMQKRLRRRAGRVFVRNGVEYSTDRFDPATITLDELHRDSFQRLGQHFAADGFGEQSSPGARYGHAAVSSLDSGHDASAARGGQ